MVALAFFFFFAFLPRGTTATAVGAVVGWVVAFSSGPLASSRIRRRADLWLCDFARFDWRGDLAVRDLRVAMSLRVDSGDFVVSSTTVRRKLSLPGCTGKVLRFSPGGVARALFLRLLRSARSAGSRSAGDRAATALLPTFGRYRYPRSLAR